MSRSFNLCSHRETAAFGPKNFLADSPLLAPVRILDQAATEAKRIVMEGRSADDAHRIVLQTEWEHLSQETARLKLDTALAEARLYDVVRRVYAHKTFVIANFVFAAFAAVLLFFCALTHEGPAILGWSADNQTVA